LFLVLLLTRFFSVTAFMQPTCTPRTLSASLVEDAAVSPALPPYASVLQHGNDTVYVLLAPGGGSCASFSDLIEALPRSVTILGLEHPNYVQPTSRQYSVDDLSELYLTALKQYSGAIKECVLVGASFGGVVAVKLATELPQHGFAVSSIALLDTPWPGSLSAGAFSVHGFLRDVYGIVMRSREFDYPTPNQSPPRPSTPSSYKSLPDCGDGGNDEVVAFKSVAVPFDTASFEAFLASAVIDGGDHSEAFRRVQKSDWRTLSAVYADNICALEQYSVEDVRLDVPALYIHAAVDGLDRHALAPWSDVFSRLFVKHIDAPHASVYTGENAKAVVASMARIVS
jgi:thioesterase domain-containing protein